MPREHCCNGRWGILRAILMAVVAASPFVGGAAGADEPKKVEGLPDQIVDALNATSGGKHLGFRAAHAKGMVCEGEFAPAATAATLSRAPHLQDKPVRVTVRFSDSSGNPTLPDGAPFSNPHGFAVRFHLPGGNSTDIVSNALNGFPVSTAEEFLEFLRARPRAGRVPPNRHRSRSSWRHIPRP